LHSNPGPPHAFVDPATGAFAGLIDFGDAYLSHPALDLWRWGDPADRVALFRGYTAEQPVDATFLQTWRVVQVLADLRAMAATPTLGPPAQADLQQQLVALRAA
jgi:Ser/Thr protein kinase RdoA (MazF antagonist)